MAHPEVTLDYAGGTGADTTTFTTANPARQIYVIGAGVIVMLDNAATPVSRTYTVNGGETIAGEWTAFTSSTCTRIRVTTAVAPRLAAAQAGALQLASNLQIWADGGAAKSAAFTAAIGTLYKLNPAGATFAVTYPAISASNAGQRIGLVNVSTGSTATVVAGTGSDNVGNSAGTATGATAAGPLGGVAQFYTADLTTLAWLKGI